MPSPEDFQNPSAADAAPVAGATTPPEAVDPGASEEQEPQEPRLFTQEELDAKIGERLAKDRRQRAKEEAERAAQPVAPPAEPPKPDQFKSAEDYLEALSDWKADHKSYARATQQQQRQANATFEDRAEKARAKYADFDIIFKHPNEGGPAISDPMKAVIQESELGPDIAYHLAKNPDESRRIWGLSPLAQARELGKIEATLSQKAAEGKKPSSAPEPITPVGSRTHTPTYDTSDPKSTKTMSVSEWIAAENKRRAKLEKR